MAAGPSLSLLGPADSCGNARRAEPRSLRWWRLKAWFWSRRRGGQSSALELGPASGYAETTGQLRRDAGDGPPSYHWVAFPTHCEACIWVPFDSNGVLRFQEIEVSSSPSIYKLGTTSRALRREPPVRPASDARSLPDQGGKAVSTSQWRDTGLAVFIAIGLTRRKARPSLSMLDFDWV